MRQRDRRNCLSLFSPNCPKHTLSTQRPWSRWTRGRQEESFRLLISNLQKGCALLFTHSFFPSISLSSRALFLLLSFLLSLPARLRKSCRRRSDLSPPSRPVPEPILLSMMRTSNTSVDRILHRPSCSQPALAQSATRALLPSYHHRPSAVCGQVPTATDITSLAVAAILPPPRGGCFVDSGRTATSNVLPLPSYHSYRQRRRWRIRGCRIQDRRTRSPLPNQLTASHHDAGDMPPSEGGVPLLQQIHHHGASQPNRSSPSHPRAIQIPNLTAVFCN